MKNPGIIFRTFVLLVCGMTLLAGCEEPPEPNPVPEIQPQVLNPDSHRDLENYFSLVDYSWENLEKGVPPFILSRVPDNLNQVSRIAKKKKLFFLSMLPMILLNNLEIEEKRDKLQQLLARYDQGQLLTPEERAWAVDLASEYRVSGDPLKDRRARRRLLRRVDIVPASLALAQAASESAYGTSRFAVLGNNLFGEWTFVKGTGMIPRARPEGATYEVRSFQTVYASLKSYMKNLNTNRAYLPFRKLREQRRELDQPLRGAALAGGLQRYSIRGDDYIRDIRNIIGYNKLSRLSDVDLRKSPDQPVGGPGKGSGFGLFASQALSSRPLAVQEKPTAD